MLNVRHLLLSMMWIASFLGCAEAGIAQDLAAAPRDSRWTASPADAWKTGSAGLSVRAAPGGPSADAVYTVPAGGSGFHAIRRSMIGMADGSGRAEFRVFVRRDNKDADPAVYTFLNASHEFEFDAFCGYLRGGDQLVVRVAANGDTPVEANVDFDVVQTPAIPVPVRWSIGEGVQDSVGARQLVGDAPLASGTAIPLKAGSHSVLATRVAQSGFYALHNATIRADARLEARIYVGAEPTPRRVVSVSDSSDVSTDLGYIARGERAYVVLSAEKDTRATFDGSLIEWAPRRPPLRVQRGEDGLLDVLPVEAPDKPADIPADHWVRVPATNGDATEALRKAFASAHALAGDGWAGVRLEPGTVYTIASEMNGGNIFELRDLRRVVLDGNGATLRITSPEIQRKGFTLFATYGATRDLVFHDLVVESTHVPFTLGRIIDVNPKSGNTQTVTVAMEEGSVDPLKEIARDGKASAYAYDPNTPGRLALGTWSHYPGAGDGPQVKPGEQPGTFTHALTRTGSSLNVGDKWLIKNKGGGLVYLATRGTSENITLSRITGNAAGGGTLRFWTTSGINILDCRFEPTDRYWISSSADGVHGRAREGVWIENTVLRGICEDIMNTYARTMAIAPDDNAEDDVITLGVYDNSVRSSKGSLKKVDAPDCAAGDRLVFFNAAIGKVVGYANVEAIDGNRVKLSRPVAGLVPWNGGNPRDLTLVYSIDSVGNFVVRDSWFMDSMRVGIYIKAKGGVVWGNTIEGQSASGVFATNEPEWPEGPPARHVWIQGNTFSQNNYGYMSRWRDYLVVDPADISIYTRKLRDPNASTDYQGHSSHGHFANDHVKIIGNTFHDWRGMGVSIRNARSVILRDNLFLPPAEDPVMRKTLSADPFLSSGGRGLYTALFLDSVAGAQVSGNASVGLPEGDRQIATGEFVEGVTATTNASLSVDARPAEVALSFSEWFGDTSKSAGGDVSVSIGGATHRVGRLGAGLHFDGGAPATFAGKDDPTAVPERSLALWYRADADADAVLLEQGGENGIRITIERKRIIIRVGTDQTGASLDLGPVATGHWEQLALTFDGSTRTLRGYVNGAHVATTTDRVPSTLASSRANTRIGGAPFKGTIDEIFLFDRPLSPADLASLSLNPIAIRTAAK